MLLDQEDCQALKVNELAETPSRLSLTPRPLFVYALYTPNYFEARRVGAPSVPACFAAGCSACFLIIAEAAFIARPMKSCAFDMVQSQARA
jgi:hypothetical protein